MNWYKKAQSYGYHATSIDFFDDIKVNGLKPQINENGEQELFFAGNEDDLSPYFDGLMLRFPFPPNSTERIARGEYYTTPNPISPYLIEYKTDIYEDWLKITD